MMAVISAMRAEGGRVGSLYAGAWGRAGIGISTTQESYSQSDAAVAGIIHKRHHVLRDGAGTTRPTGRASSHRPGGEVGDGTGSTVLSGSPGDHDQQQWPDR